MVAITEEFLRGVADDYMRHVTGRRPAMEIAKERGVPDATARRWVWRARKLGLLEPTAPGRVAGEPESAMKRAVRADAMRQAADFVRDAHFRDGLTVQEIGTALRRWADSVDPQNDGTTR
jgi:hypothetical protein